MSSSREIKESKQTNKFLLVKIASDKSPNGEQLIKMNTFSTAQTKLLIDNYTLQKVFDSKEHADKSLSMNWRCEKDSNGYLIQVKNYTPGKPLEIEDICRIFPALISSLMTIARKSSAEQAEKIDEMMDVGFQTEYYNIKQTFIFGMYGKNNKEKSALQQFRDNNTYNGNVINEIFKFLR